MAEDKDKATAEMPENEQVDLEVPVDAPGAAEDISLEVQCVSLAADLAEREKQLQEAGERVKRLQADFDNFRRRTRQEKEEISVVVAQSLIKDLLPLLDNFERALAAAESSPLKDGVEMISKQLVEILEKNGLEAIQAVGEKFDPNFHEAIMRVTDETKEDDMVAEELQKGYSVRGRVIRPSMVKVVAN